MTLLVFGIPCDNLNLSFEGLAVDHSGKACPAVEGIFNLVEDLHVKFVDVNLSGELLGPFFPVGSPLYIYHNAASSRRRLTILSPILPSPSTKIAVFVDGFITGTLLLCH